MTIETYLADRRALLAKRPERPGFYAAVFLNDEERQLAVIEAAHECVTPCDIVPATGSGRKWCMDHHEYSPCTFEELRAALAALVGETE